MWINNKTCSYNMLRVDQRLMQAKCAHVFRLNLQVALNFSQVLYLCKYCLLDMSESVFACSCVCVANKEEVVQKARPVSTDVGSSNPNFSDLMDEFIQERLRSKGTVVSTSRSQCRR